MPLASLIITGFFTSLMLVGISGAGALLLGTTLGLKRYKKAAYCFALGTVFTTVFTPIFLILARGSAFDVALYLTLSNACALTGFYLHLHGLSTRCERPVHTRYMVMHVVIYSLINVSLSHEHLIGLLTVERVVFITCNTLFVSIIMFFYIKLNPSRRASIGEKIFLGMLFLNLIFILYYPFSRIYTQNAILEYLTYRIPIQILHVHTWTVGLIVLMLSDLINIYRKQASTDGMTGLYNRKYFLHHVTQNLKTANHHHALILCDIDFFKQINDSYGHSAGDDIIIAFSDILKSTVGEDAIISRFGGEEFAIYLPDTHLDSARDVATQIKNITEQSNIKTDGHSIQFTVSLGVTELSKEISLPNALQEADQALYKAKHAGRNQVIVST